MNNRNYERNRLGEGDYTEIASALVENPSNYWIQRAEAEIESTYGDTVSVSQKNKGLLKFGQGSIDQVERMVMRLDDSETYVMDNLIDRIVSDDSNNDQIVTIEGHTIDTETNLLTFVVQSATVNGQTPVVLTTPLARLTRMYVNDYIASPIASGSTIYGFQSTSSVTNGVPDDSTKIHAVIVAGTNTDEQLRNHQSAKATTALSSQDYLIITQIYGDIRRTSGTGAKADIFLKWRQLDATGAKVFRTAFIRSIALAGSSNVQFSVEPHIIIPKNSDIIMTVVATANNTEISAGFKGALAIVTS